MRASDAQSSLIAAVEAAAVDASHGGRDKFVHVDTGGRELEQAPDRVFRAILSQPPRRTNYLTLDAYEVEYTLEVFYTPTKDVETRIAKDAEQITFDLATLQTQNSDIMVSSIGAGSVDFLDNLIVCQIPVLITYRLTGVS